VSSKLLDSTIELLHRDKGTWQQTAADTKLGYQWLAKLSQGCIDDPGVKKIETLHNYLSDKYQAA
jgi:hypothetical protein